MAEQLQYCKLIYKLRFENNAENNAVQPTASALKPPHSLRNQQQWKEEILSKPGQSPV
jgi:hypothetical protein